MRVVRWAAIAATLFVLATMSACGMIVPRHADAPAPAARADDLFEAVPGNPPKPGPTFDLPVASLEPPPPLATAQVRLAHHIARTYRIDAGHAAQIVDDCFRSARARHLRPTLLLAVIAQESSFRPEAVSSIGAVGLMQIRPELHQWRRDRLGLSGELSDPTVNIAVGAEVLKECLLRHGGDLERALTAYSGGAAGYPSKVARLELDFARFTRG